MAFFKKISVGLILIFVLSGVNCALAEPTKDEEVQSIIEIMNTYKPEKLPGSDLGQDEDPQKFTFKLLGIVIDMIIYISGTLATIGLIVGGSQYMFSMGGDLKDKGKNTLTWSLVGLVVVMLAYAIIHNVIRLVLEFTTP